MITLLIVLYLLFSGMSDIAAAKDWEKSEREAERRFRESERNKERRHREVMEVARKNNVPSVLHRENRTVQRRAIKDSEGNVIAEEVLVESLEDLI